jgi:peroxiredoxin Q/BCP
MRAPERSLSCTHRERAIHPKDMLSMKKFLLAGLFAAGVLATPALAALNVGESAPDFTVHGFLAGKPFTFNLNQALKSGPVVLYFFPAVHTGGCNLEAHLFAEAADDFKKEGATVIGVTAGNLDQLQVFSNETQYCSGKFPVVADADLKVTKEYGATSMILMHMSDRTSYVISPDHKVVLAYSAGNPTKHVEMTMDGVKKWKADHHS